MLKLHNNSASKFLSRVATFSSGILLAGLIVAPLGVAAESPVHLRPSLVGHAAPRFTRVDLDGHAISLAQYRGKVVLLNFWATWCAPCRIEMPRFVEWQQRYGAQGLQILGVSIDDDEPPVRSFASELRLNYPIVMGDAKLGRRYGGVLGVPITLLIDRRGIVRERLEGEQDLNAVERKIEQLLKR